MRESKDDIELMDYISVIWKRKWFVIILTVFCMVIAGIMSVLLPQVWEIEIVIAPSKFLKFTKEGVYREVAFIEPRRITQKINLGFYDGLIASELSLDTKEFPRLNARNIRGTNLIRIRVREKDVKKTELILDFIFQQLKTEWDEVANNEVNRIENEVELNEIEKARLVEGIQINERNIGIVKQRKKEIQTEIGRVKDRIAALEREQSLSLKKQSLNETDRIQNLYYSQIIQQTLSHLTTLKESLSQRILEEGEMSAEIKDDQARIKELDIMTDSLIEGKNRIELTESVEDITSSPQLVSPKKKLNILITGILGLMIFALAAFFLEYVQRKKE